MWPAARRSTRSRLRARTPRPPTALTGRPSPRSTLMSRYVAPLGFTLAAVWVAVLFVLAGGGH
ncbi:hypothetical protein F6X54_28650 [Micromonospora aurantiaca]|uniref:Uncharacterized protein n=1 Tax=Micromonospora aurantiaca (nom. illeg.) TaxID=47850 RepID=A0A3M9KD22_9ACTN|nr:hypothetical protein DVH21_30255 [Micromonospora aurantiaca]KAB1104096.1 hypothetical protein F6X54_28650 [Micromonospora aurantiaca]OHX06772.1 hypothetical protein BFV98_29200 [Micromonospora sp. WMMB235]RNH98955.1 hypothetical protein EEZ25_25030 [Micromonospora aurantiaca]